MSQQLAEQVIAVMRALRNEEYRLNLRALAIEEKYLFAGENKLAEKEEELRAVRDRQSHTELKLRRAQQFWLSYAKSTDPHCIFCFIEHDALPLMVRAEPATTQSDGMSYFRCARCGRESKIELSK
jgi:lipase chaperone LimK